MFYESDMFNYLGMLISNDSNKRECITEKVQSTNGTYFANRHTLRNSRMNTESKHKMYHSLRRHVHTFHTGIRMTSVDDEKYLRVFFNVKYFGKSMDTVNEG